MRRTVTLGCLFAISTRAQSKVKLRLTSKIFNSLSTINSWVVRSTWQFQSNTRITAENSNMRIELIWPLSSSCNNRLKCCKINPSILPLIPTRRYSKSTSNIAQSPMTLEWKRSSNSRRSRKNLRGMSFRWATRSESRIGFKSLTRMICIRSWVPGETPTQLKPCEPWTTPARPIVSNIRPWTANIKWAIRQPLKHLYQIYLTIRSRSRCSNNAR